MRKLIIGVVAALAAIVVVQSAAWADYRDSNGNTVRWAGGDNIVVIDKNGNTIYSGPGERSSDGSRLLWDGTSNVGSTSGKQVADAVSESSLSGKPAGAMDYSGNYVSAGILSGFRNRTQGGSSSSSPYAGTAYRGMQEITVTVDGETLTGYAAIYADRRGLGYSAISANSDIGLQLAQNGFQVKNGLVLISPGASGASVEWTANQTLGSSFTNLSPTNYNWTGGGSITINILSPASTSETPPTSTSYTPPASTSETPPTSTSYTPPASTSYTPPASTSYTPPPDTRKLVGYPEWQAVPVGKAVPLVAEVTGTTQQVRAFTAWGGSAVLEQQPDGKFRGLLQVPSNVRPGVYPLTFEARIGQSGYAESLFSVTGMLTVRGLTDTSTGGGKAPADEPDWWTPPWLQGR